MTFQLNGLERSMQFWGLCMLTRLMLPFQVNS